MTIAKFGKIMVVEQVNRLLVILDINETLLYHHRQPNGEYSWLMFRNKLKQFIDSLIASGVHIGLWTGLLSNITYLLCTGLI